MIYLIIADRLPKEAELFVVEEYRPAKLVMDMETDLGQLSTPWAALAQGGEEAGVPMLAGTENQMKQISPGYVRLDHIFDDDYYGVVSGTSGNLQFDWTKLGTS